MFRSPDERAFRKFIVERHDVGCRKMNAAVRGGTSDAWFFAGAVDVDVALKRIVSLPFVETRFQSFHPENAMSDKGVGIAVPGVALEDAFLENSASRPTATDLL